MTPVAIAFPCIALASAAFAAEAPRLSPDGVYRLDLLSVKLRDGVHVRARDGGLTDFGQGTLKPLAGLLDSLAAAGATWERAYPDLSEERLDDLRRVATRNLGKPVPDQNLQFTLRLPPTLDAADIACELEKSPLVHRAEPFLTGLGADPSPPNYESAQGYRNAPTAGIGSPLVLDWPGGRGQGVSVCDVERQWHTTHVDLPPLTRLGPATSGDPSATSDDHGTAVMGEVLARRNAWGTTGCAPDAAGFYAHVYLAGAYNAAAAINNAAAGLGPGSVMLIEQQMVGPTGGYVPMEWRLDCYNAIVIAVGNGITVCEAAANGNQNLDGAIFSTGNGGHYPFLLANDSGAILVGAGAAAGTTLPRSRLSFSDYGATVDLQGWGEAVVSLGYGDRFSAEGRDAWYTSTFSGTSSATPIVASACILLQSTHHAATGTYLTPAEVKQHLIATGTPQQPAGAAQHIGPLPDVRSAIALALGSSDCNLNAVPDLLDIAADPALDIDANGVIDSCECPADFPDASGARDGAVTIDDLLYLLARYEAGC